jgi:hypothetical protein
MVRLPRIFSGKWHHSHLPYLLPLQIIKLEIGKLAIFTQASAIYAEKMIVALLFHEKANFFSEKWS